MTAQKSIDPTLIEWLAILGLRLALGITFLSAVVDRFGWWGPYGYHLVSWGDFNHFIAYTGVVDSFLPKALIPSIAWIATVAEVFLGIALILGVYTRLAALFSGLLFAAFALAMSLSMGIKAPLNYSVFVDVAAAFLLASVGRRFPKRKSHRVTGSGTEFHRRQPELDQEN